MTGYILELSNDGTSGTIIQHGDAAAQLALTGQGGIYAFENYAGATKLRVQASVSFNPVSLRPWLAENIVWDGVTYDVPSNQVAWYQTQLS
jgi:hypothetical protein